MTFPISAAEAFADPNLFGAHFRGETWLPWLSFLKVFGGEAATLPPDLAQLAASCTDRADLGGVQRFGECWVIARR